MGSVSFESHLQLYKSKSNLILFGFGCEIGSTLPESHLYSFSSEPHLYESKTLSYFLNLALKLAVSFLNLTCIKVKTLLFCWNLDLKLAV